MQRALEAGIFGDNASGNALNLVIITKDKTQFKGPIIPLQLQKAAEQKSDNFLSSSLRFTFALYCPRATFTLEFCGRVYVIDP